MEQGISYCHEKVRVHPCLSEETRDMWIWGSSRARLEQMWHSKLWSGGFA